MTSLIADITAWVTLHPMLAYGLVFLLALSESIPVIGVVVPGTAVIVAVSALVPGGAVKLWPLMLAAFGGAVIGDGLPYWIGHRHHESILRRWPLVRYPQWIAKSERFIDRHGNKSVFLARFTPGVRAFIPLFAGILRMPARRFYSANILSAAIWAPAHVLPGVLLGASFSHLGTAALPFAGLFVILVIILWMTVKLVRFTVLRAAPHVAAAIQGLHVWATRQDSHVGHVVARLLDPARDETRSVLILGGILIGSAWLFIGIFEDVIGNDPLVRVDTELYQNLQALRTTPGDALMIAITEIGDATVVVSVALAVLVWLLIRRAWRSAVYWSVAIAGATLLNTAIKVALHRPRPNESLYTGWSAFSFPSGHSTVNVVLYGFLALLVVQGIAQRARLPVILGAALIALLIAFSRLYLGAHWASDVAGGLAFGGAWIALLGVYYLYGKRENVGASGLLIVACLALVSASGAHIAKRHHSDTGIYAFKSHTPVMGSKATPTQLPVVPALNGGRLSGLSMIEKGDNPNTRRILRFWPADIDIVGRTTVPLWLGSIIEERLYHPASLFTLVWTLKRDGSPVSALLNPLSSPQVVERSGDAVIKAGAGTVLLAGGR